MSQDPSFSSIPGLNGGENAALSNSSLCHLLLCRLCRVENEVIALEFLNTFEKETLLGYPYFT